jgi:hypothetical protein
LCWSTAKITAVGREREREGQITNKIENSNRGGKEEEEDK